MQYLFPPPGMLSDILWIIKDLSLVLPGNNTLTSQDVQHEVNFLEQHTSSFIWARSSSEPVFSCHSRVPGGHLFENIWTTHQHSIWVSEAETEASEQVLTLLSLLYFTQHMGFASGYKLDQLSLPCFSSSYVMLAIITT